MIFIEFQFFIFFAVVLLGYWTLQKNAHRKLFLLASSYVFYACWDVRFVLLLLVLSLADYYLARMIGKSEDQRARKTCVTVSIAFNLCILGFFKYFNFFVDSALAMANAMGGHLSEPALNIILPVGISFITFQSLSYTIDVYRRQIRPVRILTDYMLSVAFFPQLVAGPIMRPIYFLPQLAAKRVLASKEIQAYALMFLLGFLKKAGIADNIAPFVDAVFDQPEAYSNVAAITAVWLYAVQIYCDFSGYSDMAIAVAGLLGYRLVMNFNAPYLSASIQEFWRRWHMSLSLWIRDYIYISLGGRSKNRFITYRNLIITMLAGGLWHGAAWTFVVWGGLHGLGLVVNRAFNHHFNKLKENCLIRNAIGWFLTINFVCMTWVFFRADTFGTAWSILKKYMLIGDSGMHGLPLWLLLFAPALLLIEATTRRIKLFYKLGSMNSRVFALLYGVAWAIALAFLPLNNTPFIYFQF